MWTMQKMLVYLGCSRPGSSIKIYENNLGTLIDTHLKMKVHISVIFDFLKASVKVMVLITVKNLSQSIMFIISNLDCTTIISFMSVIWNHNRPSNITVLF